jgi:thymidylate kinase
LNLPLLIYFRFWHSTASYAYAHLIRTGTVPEASALSKELIWPVDLLQPNLVIYLTVSESVRLNRHGSRANFTNTVEEQVLAADSSFREK